MRPMISPQPNAGVIFGQIFCQAYRNLWRCKRRTLICASAIAVGLGFTVITLGMRESNYRKLMEIGAQSGYGNVTLAVDGFNPHRAAQSRLFVPAAVLDTLARLPHNIFMARRLVGEAVVNAALASTGAGYLAVDPASEPPAFNLFHAKLVDGAWLDDPRAPKVVVGRLMASKLGVKVGGEIIYTTADARGQPLALMATVAGLFATGSDELDGHLLVLPMDRLKEDLGYAPDMVSYVALYAPEFSAIDTLYGEASAAMAAMPGHGSIYHWHDTLPDLFGFVAVDHMMYRLLLVFVGIVAASGVFTTMIMNLNERRREFGTMLAVGMSPSHLFALVMIEAALLTVVGELIGLCLFTPSYLYLHFIGIDLTKLAGGSFSAGGVTRDSVILSCELSMAYFAAIFAVLLVMALLATIYPAAKAALTIPIKTIRD